MKGSASVDLRTKLLQSVHQLLYFGRCQIRFELTEDTMKDHGLVHCFELIDKAFDHGQAFVPEFWVRGIQAKWREQILMML